MEGSYCVPQVTQIQAVGTVGVAIGCIASALCSVKFEGKITGD